MLFRHSMAQPCKFCVLDWRHNCVHIHFLSQKIFVAFCSRSTPKAVFNFQGCWWTSSTCISERCAWDYNRLLQPHRDLASNSALRIYWSPEASTSWLDRWPCLRQEPGRNKMAWKERLIFNFAGHACTVLNTACKLKQVCVSKTLVRSQQIAYNYWLLMRRKMQSTVQSPNAERETAALWHRLKIKGAQFAPSFK